MSPQQASSRLNVPRALLNVTGIFFAVMALLYNPLTLHFAVRFARAYLGRPWMEMRDTGAVLSVEVAFAAIAAACFLFAWVISRSPFLDRLLRIGWIEKLVLALFVLVAPLTAIELSLRPFADHLNKDTGLFLPDPELGWTLRPSTTQPWGGVAVTTNSRGLRGPEVPFDRQPGTRRIIYLGDSVTFGYMVARWEDTFPHLIEQRLRQHDVMAETVNAGVGGYSPWQELIWLRKEGLRHTPDLVVLGFVLNDVTEKFNLVRFGGQGQSRQLRDSFHTWQERLLGSSALVYYVRKTAREFKARRRLGSDLRLGAIQQERLDVRRLINEPDSEGVRLAWNVTLESMDEIVDLCAQSQTKLMVVAFPFAMQFDSTAARAPQETLAAWAGERGVTMVDLLPALQDSLAATGAGPDRYFLDDDHLSVDGHRVVADILTDVVRSKLGQNVNPIVK